MPSYFRNDYPCTFHHVFNRGINRQNIFLYEDHFNHFLSLLYYIQDEHEIDIHAFCLMDNHYHLLIYNNQVRLSRAMYDLNRLYSIYFNRLERRSGPLFTGRYKSILVNDSRYALVLSRYIHLNPCQAKICKKPEDYPWSDYKNYESGTEFFFTQTSFINGLCESRGESYADFVSRGVDSKTNSFFDRKHIKNTFLIDTPFEKIV